MTLSMIVRNQVTQDVADIPKSSVRNSMARAQSQKEAGHITSRSWQGWISRILTVLQRQQVSCPSTKRWTSASLWTTLVCIETAVFQKQSHTLLASRIEWRVDATLAVRFRAKASWRSQPSQRMKKASHKSSQNWKRSLGSPNRSPS